MDFKWLIKHLSYYYILRHTTTHSNTYATGQTAVLSDYNWSRINLIVMILLMSWGMKGVPLCRFQVKRQSTHSGAMAPWGEVGHTHQSCVITKVITQKNTVCCSDNSFWINYTLHLICWRTTVEEPRRRPRFCNGMVTASVCIGDRDLCCCLSCDVICRCSSWSNVAADRPCAMIVRVAGPGWWWTIVVNIIVVIEWLYRALLVERVSVARGFLPVWSAGIWQKICLWRGGFKKVQTCRVIWSGGVSKGPLLLLLLLYEASYWVLMLQLGATGWCS